MSGRTAMDWDRLRYRPAYNPTHTHAEREAQLEAEAQGVRCFRRPPRTAEDWAAEHERLARIRRLKAQRPQRLKAAAAERTR